MFSKDLREAAEVGSGTNVVGNYELHDLVQLEWVDYLYILLCLFDHRCAACKLSVSFSKPNETPSVFLTRMVRYDWYSLTKYRCGGTLIVPLLRTLKVTSSVYKIMSRRLKERLVLSYSA